MVKCELCKAEVELPFQCNYCGKYFCEAHRLLENHNCPDSPPRTPLGSYHAKEMLANANKKEKEIPLLSSVTYGNIHNYHFRVPVEVYSDDKYREKLDKAKTLEEVEKIIDDYRKHMK